MAAEVRKKKAKASLVRPSTVIKKKDKQRKQQQHDNYDKVKQHAQRKRKKGDDASFTLSQAQTPPSVGVQWKSPSDQATWFTDAFKSAQGSSLSQLECSSPVPHESMVLLSKERDRGAENITWHLKMMFGESWEHLLVKEDESAVEKGNPALLILCSSAVRCVELLKGLKKLTKECKPAKLFAKHIKLDEQVMALKSFVNIAVGTPNRVKKLMDIGALGVERLSVVLLDLHEDAKGFTLLTVPQVKADFWELYRAHFHYKVMDIKMRICLF